ncbi:hypothetical protein acsn021_32980 [Anaerocolumna cellulosilytica]|uniref:Uncharacterized protein n=1 Tax=Anaerocolumna cellulosilytica TaxID=433286 RepID=A0A6S6R325_9FIRM|nr:hypothetical protein [Anaerocolumna cellulosilytica]MBB5196629.1 hypothetical protein [Anaerocolumna cellulosilytica]BCJ95729.1 hypothetical protein acsn021_32980 [Anaerocolumna cellulosilytica]
MIVFNSYSGTILTIEDIQLDSRESFGCNKLITIEDQDKNIIDLIVTPGTYFVDLAMAEEGDTITAYFDANAPVPLIYPPRFRALIIIVGTDEVNSKVDYFNRQLSSSDGMLRLNISDTTIIILQNGQPFYQDPGNHFLIVLYGPSTRSIPAQTTPYTIIVLCQE